MGSTSSLTRAGVKKGAVMDRGCSIFPTIHARSKERALRGDLRREGHLFFGFGYLRRGNAGPNPDYSRIITGNGQ